MQSLEIDHLTSGRWALVVMSPDARQGVDARVDVGVTLPWLPWASLVALVVGLVALAGAVALVVSAARGAARDRRAAGPRAPVAYAPPRG